MAAKALHLELTDLVVVVVVVVERLHLDLVHAVGQA
jgi:hypothetical protein